jgi:hypothetical protein
VCFSIVGQTEGLEGTDEAAKDEEHGDDGGSFNEESEDGEMVEESMYTRPAEVSVYVGGDDEAGCDATEALEGLTLVCGGMNVGPFRVSHL